MGIQIRFEAKRGCGYRAKGGLYMVGGKLSAPCGKLPHNLCVCPTCNQGFKPFRGWGWIDAVKVLGDAECGLMRTENNCGCPLRTEELKRRGEWRAGLIWIGEKHYGSPGEFTSEAASLGISRRIKAIPKDFVLGETWVFFAHRKAGLDPETREPCAALFSTFLPTAIEYVVKDDDTKEKLDSLEKRGVTLVRVRPLQGELRVGDAVDVYEDPISRQILEGKAKLLRLIDTDTNVNPEWHFENWDVKFLGDDDSAYRRTIRVDRGAEPRDEK